MLGWNVQISFGIKKEKCSFKNNVEALFEWYFSDCDFPRPSKHDLQTVLDFVIFEKEIPEYIELNQIKICDPYEIALEIIKKNMGTNQKMN